MIRLMLIKWCCNIGEWKKECICLKFYEKIQVTRAVISSFLIKLQYLTYLHILSTLLITQTQYYSVHLGPVNKGYAEQRLSTLCVTIQNNVVDIQQVTWLDIWESLSFYIYMQFIYISMLLITIGISFMHNTCTYTTHVCVVDRDSVYIDYY